MSKMTSDLYYTQLCEINGYTVNDKRIGIRMASAPQSSDFEDGKISLYAVISKKENTSKWISTINIYDSSRKAVFSEAKEYDSFYKILMEPKASLQETISTLLSGSGTVAQAPVGSSSPSKPASMGRNSHARCPQNINQFLGVYSCPFPLVQLHR